MSRHLKYSGRKVTRKPGRCHGRRQEKDCFRMAPRHLGWKLHKEQEAKTSTAFGNMETNILTCGCKSWTGVVWRVREIERANVTIRSKVWLLWALSFDHFPVVVDHFLLLSLCYLTPMFVCICEYTYLSSECLLHISNS